MITGILLQAVNNDLSRNPGAHPRQEATLLKPLRLCKGLHVLRAGRGVHDSVTQSLYSLTLFTEAARQMAEDADYYVWSM